MIKIANCTFIMLLLITSLTGCWSRKEIPELGIVLGMGIDKTDEDNFLVSYQVVDPGENTPRQSSGNRTPVSLFQARADNLFEAAWRATMTIPRKLYFSHIRILIISEELAKEGIKNVIDFMSRDHEMRPDFFVMIAKGHRAEDILKVLTPLEKIPANNMFDSLRMSEQNWAPTYGLHLDKLINEIVTDGNEAALSGIRIDGELEIAERRLNVEEINSPGKLVIEGISVFKGDKLIGWFNEVESKGFNYIIDNVTYTAGQIECPNGNGDKIAIEISSAKTKVDVKLQNEKPFFELEVDMIGNIGEVACKIDLTKTENINAVEKLVGEKVKTLMETTIKKAQQEYNSDVFAFGDTVYRTHPKAWKELSGNWDKEFPNLEVSIRTNVTLRSTGTLNNSFIQKLPVEK
ncbi:Ger(x)C family spore germination protein [Chengkuizengella marina]|nr:Ger(x)C family spore germination protein [Chengkuizengella marina]